MNMYWKLRRFAALSFRYKAFQTLLLLVISILIIFLMALDFDVWHDSICPNSASGSAFALRGKGLEIESHSPDFFSSAYVIFSSREPAHAPEKRLLTSKGVEKVHT